MKKAIVVLNEQHTLRPQQQKLLIENFDEYEVHNIPSAGITTEQAEELAQFLGDSLRENVTILIASPVPALIFWLSKKQIPWTEQAEELAQFLGDSLRENVTIPIASPVPALIFWLSKKQIPWGVFVSPRPQKIEKNGEIKFTVPEEGWEILLP